MILILLMVPLVESMTVEYFYKVSIPNLNPSSKELSTKSINRNDNDNRRNKLLWQVLVSFIGI